MLQLIGRLAPPWQDAVKAALLGDAFGVPHEFKEGFTLPHAAQLEMVMPPAYRKSYIGVAYGTWSDDGSQMMALLDAVATGAGTLDVELFGRNLLAWLHDGRYQAGGAVFDCGLQTLKALQALAKGQRYEAESLKCGNGSLMRVLPVAALPATYGVSQASALRIAMTQSDLTHPQALARVCCALYVALAWQVSAAGREGRSCVRSLLPAAAKTLLDLEVLSDDEHAALNEILAFGSTNMPTNSGFVVNTFWSALWAIDSSNSLSETLRTVVSAGRDTDTVACVAGGLAALVYGWDDTSYRWWKAMHVLA